MDMSRRQRWIDSIEAEDARVEELDGHFAIRGCCGVRDRRIVPAGPETKERGCPEGDPEIAGEGGEGVARLLEHMR